MALALLCLVHDIMQPVELRAEQSTGSAMVGNHM